MNTLQVIRRSSLALAALFTVSAEARIPNQFEMVTVKNLAIQLEVDTNEAYYRSRDFAVGAILENETLGDLLDLKIEAYEFAETVNRYYSSPAQIAWAYEELNGAFLEAFDYVSYLSSYNHSQALFEAIENNMRAIRYYFEYTPVGYSWQTVFYPVGYSYYYPYWRYHDHYHYFHLHLSCHRQPWLIYPHYSTPTYLWVHPRRLDRVSWHVRHNNWYFSWNYYVQAPIRNGARPYREWGSRGRFGQKFESGHRPVFTYPTAPARPRIQPGPRGGGHHGGGFGPGPVTRPPVSRPPMNRGGNTGPGTRPPVSRPPMNLPPVNRGGNTGPTRLPPVNRGGNTGPVTRPPVNRGGNTGPVTRPPVNRGGNAGPSRPGANPGRPSGAPGGGRPGRPGRG